MNEIMSPDAFVDSLEAAVVAPVEVDADPGETEAIETEAKAKAEEPEAKQEAKAEKVEKQALGVEVEEQEAKPEGDEKQEVDELLADEKDEKAEAADEKKEAEPELIEVKVDGETQKVTQDELKKSYERVGASTKRFQQASQIKKDADEAVAESKRVTEKARGIVGRLVNDPKVLLEVVAPETLRRAFEEYAKLAVGDQKLYDADPDLYESTVRTRNDQADLKRQRADIARQQEEIKASKTAAAKERDDQEYKAAKQLLDEQIPRALKAAGVPIDNDDIDLDYLGDILRQVMRENWTDDVGLTKSYIAESAKELVELKRVKNYLAKFTEKPAKKEPEAEAEPAKKVQKAKMTVGDPTRGGPKPKFEKPSDFFNNLDKVING